MLSSKFYYRDLNNDGIKDLLYSFGQYPFGNENGGIGIYARFADGISFGPGTLLVSLENSALITPPVDFDGDGDLDLQIYTVSPNPTEVPAQSYYWLENESWQFDTLHPLNSSGDLIYVPSQIDEVTRLDLDGDGDLDQVFWLPTDRVSGFNRLGWKETKNPDQSGLGTLTYLERLSREPFATPRWANRNSHILADLDNDGINDLVVGSTFFARLEWFKITHATQPPSYEAWAASKGVTGHSASPLADWDDDSFSNWEEFAFGSNPNQVDPDHPGRPAITVDESGPILTFHRRSDAANEGLAYQYFQSQNLQSWSPWAPNGPIPTPLNDGYEKVSVPLAQPRGFFDIQLPLPAIDPE